MQCILYNYIILRGVLTIYTIYIYYIDSIKVYTINSILDTK